MDAYNRLRSTGEAMKLQLQPTMQRAANSGLLLSLFALGFAALLPAGAQTRPAAAGSHPGYASIGHPPGLENPVANPRAVVIVGHARFTVLTPQLLRLEWAADGKFEDHASFVFLNRNLPVPSFTHKLVKGASGEVFTLQTRDLTLTYKPAPGSDGKFTADNLDIHFLLHGKPVDWHPGMAATGNLQGTTRTLDGARGDKTKEPIGQGLISRDGWVVVDDSKRPLFDSANFQFTNGENSPWPWVLLRPPGERQDWYFFGYGHDYKQALGDFVRVAGRIPLPPYFAFGTWWSRYWAYSDQELDNLIEGFHENDVPLDVLVIDMDWHPTFRQNWWTPATDQSGHNLGWSGYSWNKLLFPDPTAFLSKVHAEGLKATLNLHPASGIQPWETRYPEMARAMGIDPATKKYVPFDITNKKFATNYLDIMHHPLEKQGIDFWWLDWQQEANTKTPGVNPTWWLNYVHFTDQAREGKRPLLFHRWGGLGNHRYQIGFSGDTISVWDSLAFQPWFTATAANVGYAYWSHDIGGHMPGAVDPELYTRWIQFGAFSPILRTHTTKNPEAERRIWAYPEPYSDIMRKTFHLRYAMIPYIYTEGRRTYDTGVAFLRPLYYNWPEADQAYSAKNEYQFGKEMLVAPVTQPVDATSQLAAESIWLPPGQWIEWETGKRFTGPIQLHRNFSIRQIPVYVSAGAIVPMAPPMLYTGQKPLNPLILTVFPQNPGSSSHYTLYQDAGNTRAYQQDQAAWTAIHAAQTASDLTITIDPARGAYPGMLHQRAYELRLPGDWPPSSVTANGKTIAYSTQKGTPGWRYEGNTLTTIIELPSYSVAQAVVIHVERPASLIERRAELDGFAGTMTRLREVYDTLNQTYPLAWSPDELIDAMQTGDRITYHPETVSQELIHFHAVLPQAMSKVRGMKNAITQQDQDKLAKILGQNWQHSIKKQLSQYQDLVARATAQLQDLSDSASAAAPDKQAATGTR
jgi:alpha-glucosidase (family GH31 glycosyl hydrolase)